MVSLRHDFRTAIVALALCLAAPASASAADTALTVGKANATSDAIIPVNVGDKLGIFKKHGLDLTITDFGGGGKMAQAMAAGAIDIGDGAGTEMAFVAKGAPMIAVCESTTNAPFLGVGVPWDSPVKSLADLKGKIIGVSSTGSFSDWSGHELARSQGWGENGVKTVAIGGGTGPALAALRTHLVDAVIGNATQFFVYEETKEGRFIAPVSSYEGKRRFRNAVRLEPADRQQSKRDPCVHCRLDRDRRLHAGAQGRDGQDRKRAQSFQRDRDGARIRSGHRHVHKRLPLRC